MSRNASYFVDSLPDVFDEWNVSARLDYYNEFLSGFSQLGNTSQVWVAENFNRDDIQWLWSSIQDPTYVQDLLDMGYNTTQIFYEYLSDPARVQELIGYFTTTTTEAPQLECSSDLNENTIVQIMLIPAVAVILFLSFLKRRKSLHLNCCFGRPHLVYPINFVDEHDQRWAYACVFAILTYKVLSLFDQELFWKPEEFNDPEWLRKYGWSKVFLVILNVAWLCLVYYPFFACLVLRKHLAANIIALLYICPWLWYFIETLKFCPFWDRSHTTETKSAAIMYFVLDIPVILGFLCLIVTYIYNLVMSIKQLCKDRRKYEVKPSLTKLMEKDPLSVQYVRDLMKQQAKQKPTSMFHKIKSKVMYRRIVGFKYSPRVLCTMVVAGLGIYKFAVMITVLNEISHQYLLKEYSSLEDAGVVDKSQVEIYKDYIYITKWSFVVAIWLSFLLHVIFMFHMVAMYRRNLMKYFQGDRSWHFESSSSPTDVMIASMRYSGYQMAYLVYGFLILLLLLAALMIAFGILIALPIKYRYFGVFIRILIDYWPTIIVTIGILLLHKFLAKCCLLQERGKYMALNNRRFYHVVSFFYFFYNFLVGLFSCLKRIVFSIVFGTLLVSRLDHCLLMRGFERFDPGFRAYIGMLTVDVYHTHPVMKTFIYILQQLQEDRLHAYTNGSSIEMDVAENGSVNFDEKFKRSKKYKNKWFKAVTLMRNPTLRLDLIKDEIKQNKAAKHEVRDAVINRTGDVAAGVIGLGIIGTASG